MAGPGVDIGPAAGACAEGNGGLVTATGPPITAAITTTVITTTTPKSPLPTTTTIPKSPHRDSPFGFYTHLVPGTHKRGRDAVVSASRRSADASSRQSLREWGRLPARVVLERMAVRAQVKSRRRRVCLVGGSTSANTV